MRWRKPPYSHIAEQTITTHEDVLLVQEGVPDAIAALIEAGMRVWMITGDKQETAINIGISCGLINDPEHLLVRRRPAIGHAVLARALPSST